MKKIFAALSLLYSASGLAGQTISMQPGSRITILPSVETTVSCVGGTTPPSGVFCKCEYEFTVNFVYWKLNRVSSRDVVTLDTGSTNSHDDSQAACNRVLANHPSCRS